MFWADFTATLDVRPGVMKSWDFKTANFLFNNEGFILFIFKVYKRGTIKQYKENNLIVTLLI